MAELKNASIDDIGLLEQANLPGLLKEMKELLESSLQPLEFYGTYLGRIVSATQALGGAVWQITENLPHLELAQNWNALGVESIPEASACHAMILRVASQRERPLWIPPHSGRKMVDGDQQAANLTERGLLLAPVIVAGEVAGLVELWLEPISDVARRRELARFVSEATGFLAAYFHKQKVQSLLCQKKLWTDLENFGSRVHASLDPITVAQWTAHEGRRLLQCDQVSVATLCGPDVKVAAISGAAKVEQSSKLVRSLQTLCREVLSRGQKLVYQGKHDDTLPPALAHALDAYLTETNVCTLILLPLKDGSDYASSPHCGLLCAEAHDPGMPAEQLVERMEILAKQCAPALANARTVAHMPLRKLSRLLAGMRAQANASGLKRLAFYTIPALLVLAAFGFVHIPLRLASTGQLLPMQRQTVYASFPGKIVEVKVRPGDRVDKGQELLFIEALETQLQVDQLAIKISLAEQRLALLSEQIGKSTSNEERSALARERINQDYELRKAMAERDIILQANRSPRKAAVFAPLAGKAVTFDLQEQLLGKTVKPGDPLLRVAAVKGSWEIELDIPERSLGAIREGLRDSRSGFVDVDFLLTNKPHRSYQGRLSVDGLGGETIVKDNKVVLPTRMQIHDSELAAQLETLPVGLEVRSKIHCGSRPIAQVWFSDLWEFVYENLIF